MSTDIDQNMKSICKEIYKGKGTIGKRERATTNNEIWYNKNKISNPNENE